MEDLKTNFIGQMQIKKYRLFFLMLALVTSLLYDFLIYNQQKGIGFLLFFAIFLVSFVFLTKKTGQIKNKWALLFLIPIGILTLDVFLFNNNFVEYLVPWIIFGLTLVFSLVLTLKNPDQVKFSFLALSFPSLYKNFSLVTKEIPSVKSFEKRKMETVKNIIKGLLISLPLIFFFTLLFSSSDQIFANYLKEIIDAEWLRKIFEWNPEIIWRILRTLVLFLFIASFLYFSLGLENKLKQRKEIGFNFNTAMVVSLLTVLNLLFLGFVIIQFRYLFGDYNFVINNGLVFSEYAKNGYFQMAFATVVSGLLTIVIYRGFTRSEKIPKSVVMALAFFLLQSMVIAVSALKRLNLYQQAYGYTEARIYGEWFIYYIIAALLLVLVGIMAKWKFGKFSKFFIALLLLGLVTVASKNADYIIAKKNINRFIYDNKNLDYDYLKDLGIDISPALNLFNEEKVKSKMTGDDLINLGGLVENIEYSESKAEKWQEYGPMLSIARQNIQEIKHKYQDDFSFWKEKENNFVNKYVEVTSGNKDVVCARSFYPPQNNLLSCRQANIDGKNIVFALDRKYSFEKEAYYIYTIKLFETTQNGNLNLIKNSWEIPLSNVPEYDELRNFLHTNLNNTHYYVDFRSYVLDKSGDIYYFDAKNREVHKYKIINEKDGYKLLEN